MNSYEQDTLKEDYILIPGKDIYDSLMNDLSQVMDHSYDLEEIFLLYSEWIYSKEDFVNEFARDQYGLEPGADDDDYIGLRNAMINLYCSIDVAIGNVAGLDITGARICLVDDTIVVGYRRK